MIMHRYMLYIDIKVECFVMSNLRFMILFTIFTMFLIHYNLKMFLTIFFPLIFARNIFISEH